MTFVTREKFQSDSVYKFFLSDRKEALGIAVTQVILQMFILMVFLLAADGDSPERSYSYRYSCPSNSVECESTIEIQWYTIGVCGLIIFLYLLKDILDGLL